VTRLRAQLHDDDTRTLRLAMMAGPAFVGTFTWLGRRRPGYEARAEAVSALAVGPDGWRQRVNFVIVGGIYCAAAVRLRRRVVREPLTPVLLAAPGIGLIGSGLFVPSDTGAMQSSSATPVEVLHNVFALPVFLGIPAAAVRSAYLAGQRRQTGWTIYSAGSAAITAVCFTLFSAAFAGNDRVGGVGGALQRTSIVSGFGWLTAALWRSTRP
jgi:Protein of unknown function (DUF998)